jgi:hypothetical protein
LEVHHENIKVKEKHFKHYLFDFFMLFLAVTLGFLVENARDRITENRREKEYIQSVTEDLKQDVYQLDSITAKRYEKDKRMDSLLSILNSANLDAHGNDIYYYSRWLPRTYTFFANDRTVQQLNSGNWRLIRNNKAADAILSYTRSVRWLAGFIEHREENLMLHLYPSLHTLFDNRVFESMIDQLDIHRPLGNPKLLSTDKAAINEFCNQIHFAKNANLYYTINAEVVIKEAKKTLAVLKEEYHLN